MSSALTTSEARTLLFESLATLAPRGHALHPVLLAVSGGPDSLALLLLAAENRVLLRASGVSLAAATVDHGLRAASAAEAAHVATIASRLDIPHRTLGWEDPKPKGNLSGEARAARYRLLTEHARAIGAVAVLTAHHEDDQIETHRLAAGRHAGDRGLAAMRAGRALAPGLRLLRPLLGVPGAALKAAVAERGVAAVDDPTNRDLRYERPRLRALPPLDPDARREVLARIADHAARRDAEDAALARVFHAAMSEAAFSVDDCGTVRLSRETFHMIDPGLADVLLSRVLRAVGASEYAPTRSAVRRLAERLREDTFAAATLGGVAVQARETFLFFREYGRNGLREQAIGTARVVPFDRRFRVTVPGDSGRGRLVAFGAFGRGNAVEKTLPVLLGEGGRIRAAHPRLSSKLGDDVPSLGVSEDVSFRIFADLKGMPGI